MSALEKFKIRIGLSASKKKREGRI